MAQPKKALRDLVELGKEHGYVTLEEMNRSLTNASMSSEEIDTLMGTLEELGIDVARKFADELALLADLEADGIVERTPEGIVVTETGLPFVRVVAARFDAYLRSGTGCHSRAV